ncbi:MAG: hypothetical protein LBJ21_09380 [Acidobacteriota bacterium]|jgi:hypothetical protein|nr:hypothetical protein [Acidobacteriota bacterium]
MKKSILILSITFLTLLSGCGAAPAASNPPSAVLSPDLKSTLPSNDDILDFLDDYLEDEDVGDAAGKRLSSGETVLINPGGEDGKLAFPFETSIGAGVFEEQSRITHIVTFTEPSLVLSEFTPDRRNLVRNDTFEVQNYDHFLRATTGGGSASIKILGGDSLFKGKEIRVSLHADDSNLSSVAEDGNWFMRHIDRLGYTLYYKINDEVNNPKGYYCFAIQLGDNYGDASHDEVFAAARDMIDIHTVQEDWLSGTDENGNASNLSGYTFINDIISNLAFEEYGLSAENAKYITRLMMKDVKFALLYNGKHIEYSIDEYLDPSADDIIDTFTVNGIQIHITGMSATKNFHFPYPNKTESIRVQLYIPPISGMTDYEDLSVYKDCFIRDFS